MHDAPPFARYARYKLSEQYPAALYGDFLHSGRGHPQDRAPD